MCEPYCVPDAGWVRGAHGEETSPCPGGACVLEGKRLHLRTWQQPCGAQSRGAGPGTGRSLSPHALPHTGPAHDTCSIPLLKE